MNQYSYQYGVAGMSNIDDKQFFSLDDDAAQAATPSSKAQSRDLNDIDLTLTSDKEVSKKSFHNFKRVIKKSPARSLASAGLVTFMLCGVAFYSLGGTNAESKAGRDVIGLDTVEFDQTALGRDTLTQSQVDHIQTKEQGKADDAISSNTSYTPQFSDVLVATEVADPEADAMVPTQVSFDGGVTQGSSFVDPATVANTSLASGTDYGSSASATGYGAISNNYGVKSTSAMPAPAIQNQSLQPLQTNSTDPNATYQTNGGGDGGAGGGAGGGGGDGGMGMGGPNSTGIDPSIEALRQSLEDDYTQQQQYQDQYQTSNQQDMALRQQALQEQIQQRQEGVSQSLAQQQQGFLQPNSGNSFSAATYIPKQTSSANSANNIWNNNLSGLATGAATNQSQNGNSNATPAADEFAKDLPRYVVRVGTTWQVVVENQVNTDNGTTVFARVLSGPYSGARLIGTVKATGLGDRSAGVLFETLIPVRQNKNALPVQAVGMTLGDLNTHIATSVNRHYLQRYSALIAQGITGGYAEAYEDTSGSTSQIVNPDGTIVVVSNKTKPDSEEIKGQVIGQLGGELKGEFGKIRARPTTYVIAQGTPLTIMFTQNLDTKRASVGSISIGQSTPSTYSNTSSYGMTPRTVN